MAANSADHESSSTKCYSAIFRRLLCSGNQPTRPSDQCVEPSIGKFGDQNAEKSLRPEEYVKQGVNSNPGVVARLMGLDSFPNTPLAQKDRSLGSIFRSRSVNSIDFLSHFDPIKQHRRVRTSVSFREGINYHDCISVVSNLGKIDETGEDDEEENRNKKEKRGRNEISEKLREKKVIKKKTSKKVEMEEQRRPVCVKLSSQKKDLHGKKRESFKERRPVMKKVNSKEEMMPSKCLKKNQNKILAHKGCKVHPEGILPEIAGGEHSRQNLPSQIAHSQSPNPNSAHSHNGEIKVITYKGKKEKKLNINNENCYYKRMVEIICGLTEESLNENWKYEMALKFDDFEETICKQLGQEILEVLLKQFVDELGDRFKTLGQRVKV